MLALSVFDLQAPISEPISPKGTIGAKQYGESRLANEKQVPLRYNAIAGGKHDF
jgi:hypothetical protein